MIRHKKMPVRPCVVTCALLTALAGIGQSQPQQSSNTKIYPQSFPVQLSGKVAAMGTRLQVPGQERVVLTGTLTQSSATSSVKVYYQLPNQFRIDETGSSFGFSGTGNWDSGGTLAAADEDMLETFLDDSSEATFYALLHTASLRVLATQVPMAAGTTSSYTGPWSDIFDVMGRSQARSDHAPRQKHYYFDSQTRLLSEVRYRILRSGARVEVKSQRSNWTTVNGQAIPGTITRIENAQTVFTFSATSISLSAAASDGTFTGTSGN
jgi:hypothetical protein